MKTISTLFLLLFYITCFGQKETLPPLSNHLFTQIGISSNNFNTLGFQYFFEYQKNINENVLWGIAYDRHQYMADGPIIDIKNLPTSESMICGYIYYNSKSRKGRVSFTVGIGLGLMHVNWELGENNPIRPVLNLSITMGIKISKHLDVQFSPFLVCNRFYYSPFPFDTYKSYRSVNLIPIGIKYNF